MTTTHTARKTITDWAEGHTKLENGTAEYIPCDLADIPNGVRFDVPRQNQGQIVEVAYGVIGRAPGERGDAWKSVTDRSISTTPKYYRLVAR